MMTSYDKKIHIDEFFKKLEDIKKKLKEGNSLDQDQIKNLLLEEILKEEGHVSRKSS